MAFIFFSIFRSVDAVHKLTLGKIHVLQPDLPNIIALLTLLATLPASSAEVERGFSQLKLLKSSLRTSLSDHHLNELMVIKMLSPDVASYNPQEAMRKWLADGQLVRRFHPSIQKRPVAVVGNQDEEEGQAAAADENGEADGVDGASAEHVEVDEQMERDSDCDCEDSGYEYSDDSDMEEDRIDAILKTCDELE